ncbi:MAG: hypothetical protein MZV65_18010 [Chromatiales bacterium]|nr:hypothetical protein [Chromatiales bacterium]
MAGLITGCIGAGGGFIIAPALMSAGIKGILAVGTDLFHIFAKAIMGSVHAPQARQRLGVAGGGLPDRRHRRRHPGRLHQPQRCTSSTRCYQRRLHHHDLRRSCWASSASTRMSDYFTARKRHEDRRPQGPHRPSRRQGRGSRT